MTGHHARTTCTCSQGDDIERRATRAPRPARRAAARRRTTRGAGRWRRTRRSGSTRSTPTPGGHTVPFIVSWPARPRPSAAAIRRQYAHVTDVLPTLLRAHRRRAAGRARRRRRSRRSTGASFAADARPIGARRAAHPEQSSRCNGHRGLLQRRLGDRHPAPAADAVRRRTSGSSTTSTPTRPSCDDLAAAEPERVARDGRRVGASAPGRTRSTRSTRAARSST